MMKQRVEVEFIKGNDDWKERRIFAEAEIVEFTRGESLYVSSIKEGKLYINLRETRLVSFSTEPMSIFVNKSEVDQKILLELGSDGSRLIPAIKLCREFMGLGLKEAKDYVCALRSTPNID